MKARKWICHVHTDGIIGMDNLGNHKRTFSEIPESDRFWVTEIQPLLAELQAVRKYINYYPENCDACNYSGIDENEFSARGCPSCDCLSAKVALARLNELIKTLEDGG